MRQKTIALSTAFLLLVTGGLLGWWSNDPGTTVLAWTLIIAWYLLAAYAKLLRQQYQTEKHFEVHPDLMFRYPASAPSTFIVRFVIWLAVVGAIVAPALRVLLHRLWFGSGHFLCGHVQLFWWREL